MAHGENQTVVVRVAPRHFLDVAVQPPWATFHFTRGDSSMFSSKGIVAIFIVRTGTKRFYTDLYLDMADAVLRALGATP